jgi:hypothetical protein
MAEGEFLVMLRTQLINLRCRLEKLLPIAGLLAATWLPAAAAFELAFKPPSTLDAQVAPPNADLSATIAPMIKGDAGPSFPAGSATSSGPSPKSRSAAPQQVAVKAAPGRTKWRPAGQTGRGSGANAPRASQAAQYPKPPTPPAALTKSHVATRAPSTNPPAAKPAPTKESPKEAEAGSTLTPTSEADDDLAPIDELSETPAPASDAPGDPIEPEYTGPQTADSSASAKPLETAPLRIADASRVPLGEPDRLAKPSKSATPPTNPEDYQDREAEAAPPKHAAPLPPLSRNQRALREKVRSVLKYYYDRPLNTGNRGPWEVMHAMLAYEVHSRVLQGGPNGEPITAVGWLCFNQPCRNRSLMYLNEEGQLRVRVGPALQGHEGQLLALLAQARVRADYPIKVDGKDFTVADLIAVEKSTCYPKTELTFKLIGLLRYLDMNARWVNDQGVPWDFPSLVREEMHQPVRTAACGGTHRLSGLTLAVKKRRASGLPVDGVYAEAAQFVANYQNYAYRLQNADGSFSTEWFKGPGSEPDIDRRLKTTGHILEWLLYAASEEQITNYRTVRAVNYLTNIMHANRTRDWEAGPLGHAIHALVLYDRLAFAKYDAPVASQPRAAQR